MEASVTVHDRLGRALLSGAVEPLTVDQAIGVLQSAVLGAARSCLGPTPVMVDLTLCGDAEMEHLNFDHMGERGATDVLSFPLHEWTLDGRRAHLADEDGMVPGAPLLLGDVVIDVDQAVRQAAEGGWSVIEEMALLAVHGTLHLVGHDHSEMEDEARMRVAERAALASLHRRHREVAWKPGSLFDRAGHAVTASN